MSVIEPESSYSRLFLSVLCPCGKALRAKTDQAGEEICCWSCHRMVPVPVPRSPERALQALGQGWAEVLQPEIFGALCVAAVAVTALLAVPYAGIALMTAALVLVALGYGELIRRSPAEASAEGEADAGDEAWTSRRRWAVRGLAAAALGVGLASPLWLAPGGLGQPARLSWLTLPVLLVALFGLPLVMAVAFAPGAPWPLRRSPALTALRRYPVSVALALAIVPLTAVLVELLLLAVCYHFSLLPFLLLDLFPRPEAHLALIRLRPDLSYAFGTDTTGAFFRMYLRQLGEGYTLIGAIPPSLPVPKDMVYSLWSGNMENHVYFAIRVALTFLTAVPLLMALALQARWLGLIAALEGRRAGGGARETAAVATPAEAGRSA